MQPEFFRSYLLPELWVSLLVAGNALYLLLASFFSRSLHKGYLRWLSILIVLPSIYQISGLQTRVDIQARYVFESLGWYDNRQFIQLTAMLIILLVGSIVLFKQVRQFISPTKWRYILGLLGGAGFLIVSLMQLISFHDVDTALNQSLATWKYLDIAKLITLAMISSIMLIDLLHRLFRSRPAGPKIK